MVQEPVLASSPIVAKPHQLLDDGARVRMVARRLRDAAEAGEEEKLDGAIADFEAFFIFYMLKTMRETVQKTGLLGGGMQEEMYTALLDQEIAKGIAAGGGIGVGKLLRDQLLQEPGGLEPPRRSWRLPAAPARPEERKSAGGWAEFGVPVAGKTSSRYGLRSDPLTGSLRFHAGIDIAAPAGTVVEVSGDGRVAFGGTLSGYGNVVIVEHAGGFSTLYAHHRENLVDVRGDDLLQVPTAGRLAREQRRALAHRHDHALLIAEFDCN